MTGAPFRCLPNAFQTVTNSMGEPEMISTPALGNCQCGALKYEVAAKPFVQYTCHCSECQKLTSSAFSLCVQVPAECVTILKGQPKSRTRVADSGNQLTTWFCADCGSALIAQNSARPKLRTIFAGTLEHPQEVDVDAHIWLHSKLPWVQVPEGHRQFAQAGDWSKDYENAPERLKP
jgi:hypothetical protein